MAAVEPMMLSKSFGYLWPANLMELSDLKLPDLLNNGLKFTIGGFAF